MPALLDAEDYAVRINDGVIDRHVTRYVTDLTTRTTAPGGFHSCSFRLNLPPDLFPNLGPAAKVYVYDHLADVDFEGFIDNPGATIDRTGTGLDITATGTGLVLADRRRPLPYLERDLEGWEQVKASAAATSASAATSDDPTAVSGTVTVDAEQGLLCQFNPGQPVDTGYVAQIGYDDLVDADMQLGAVGFDVKSGKTSADYRTDIITSSGPGTAITIGAGTPISTTTATATRYVAAPGSFPAGQNRVAVQLRRTGPATNVIDDTTWSWFSNLSVVARRMSMTGVLISATTLQAQGGLASVRADAIVADLVGRVLTGQIDPQNTIIETAAWPIDQLAFTDAVTARDVLDALTLWEPDLMHEVLESTPGRGYRMNYRRWAADTDPRYEVTTRDGYTAPGGDVDLCNQITVEWYDRRGVKRSTVVTASSADYPDLAELEAQGRVREADPVMLEQGLGSQANADRIGRQVLASYATVPVDGTVVVRRPVRDLHQGGWVAPHAIRPGFPVLVRDLGQTLRCTEVEYDRESQSAQLTLGTPVLTREQRIARLSKRRPRR